MTSDESQMHHKGPEEGGGGGMLGGVDRGCVFTSAGESGIAAAFSFLLAEEREKEREKQIK